MSVQKYLSLLQTWKRIEASIEQGKVHAKNQERFKRMGQLDKRMESLGLTDAQKKSAWAKLSKST